MVILFSELLGRKILFLKKSVSSSGCHQNQKLPAVCSLFSSVASEGNRGHPPFVMVASWVWGHKGAWRFRIRLEEFEWAVKQVSVALLGWRRLSRDAEHMWVSLSIL
jgi:hypothetical protein